MELLTGLYGVLWLVLLVVGIIVRLILASFFQQVAEEKGFFEIRYFWVTFLFGLVGVALVAVLPDRGMPEKTNEENNKNYPESDEYNYFLLEKTGTARLELNKDRIKKAVVGDCVKLGAYKKDELGKKMEDIEWLVLAKEDNKLLLISKYALDSQAYNTSYGDVSWETCTLRTWLNSTFVNNTFSSVERALINTTVVPFDNDTGHGTDLGNSTRDRVFLLSTSEAEKYFASNDAIKCLPTDYAVMRGVGMSDSYSTGGKKFCWWWLRSPGDQQSRAVGVDINGDIGEHGYFVSYAFGAVRPALWIDLES